jgi:multidrug resistance protein, MATE family
MTPTQSGKRYWMPFGQGITKAELRSYVLRSWSVSWPMTLIMLFEFLIGITDVYIAGRVGKEIQATYGFVIQIYFLFIITVNALTVGTVSVVSRSFTSGNQIEFTQAVFSSVLSAAGTGIFLAILGFIFAPEIITLVNLPGELKHLGIPFVKIYALGLLFSYLLINTNGILRSCNRVKTSLKTMAIVCGLNITLNFLFTFHTPLTFRGIAVATVSSLFIGSMINLWHLRKLPIQGKRFSIRIVNKMFQIGWPMGFLQILWQMASMVIFSILSSLPEHKVEILAAFATGLRIESVIFLPAFAFNLANAVVIGNLFGEKKTEEAFRSGLITATIGLGIVLGMVLAVILNAWRIASFLSNNPVVIQESVKYIYISMVSEPFMAWGMMLVGGLNGAGDTRSVMLRVGLSVWLIRIPLCYIFVILLGFGAGSVWWAMNLSQFVQAFLISRRYFSKAWL